jgi:exodeoxyribonuclease-5
MIELTDEQSAAYEAMQDFIWNGENHTFTVFGLAGTGKTTLLARFASEHDHACLVTLTGKAASVLYRKTGIEARTIHSFFYHLEEILRDKKTGKEIELIFSRAFRDQALADRPLVLLDECSMVGREIAQDILDTGARILACGDPGQLLPVKDEAFFVKGDIELQQIHRQAMDSPIIRQAHRVREGYNYETDGDAVQLHRYPTPEDVLQADILLCFTNDQRKNLNARLRRLKGIVAPEPQPGEPVMCRKNLSDLNLYNGAIYTLLETFKEDHTHIVIDVEGTPMVVAGVRFEDRPSKLDWDLIQTWFSFGYACTVHKGAGSEWPRVTLFDSFRRGKADERRRWLYTGITRAADAITIITG